MSDLEQLTVAQLKEKLKKAGLSVSGRKKDLIERFQEYVEDNGEPSDQEEEEDEEEDEDPSESSSSIEVKKPSKKKSAKTTTTTPKKRKADVDPAPADSAVVPSSKKKKTGTIKVDDLCSLRGGAVVEDWGVTLNQTDIKKNNNKFYIIQVITSGGSYYCFTRWGRVGEKGRSACKACDDVEDAQVEFCKKFKDKTLNPWPVVRKDPSKFKTFKGQYTLLEMDYGDEEEVEKVEKVEKVKKKQESKENKIVKPCSLPAPTQALLKLIFDHDMFKEQMKKFDIDVKKLPLGALSKAQLNKGYQCLDEIEEALNDDDDDDDDDHLEILTNKFYTLIPHAYGRQRPPPINTAEMVQTKRDMLSVLGDIEIAHNLGKDTESDDKEIDHPLDANYKLLDADLEVVDKASNEWKMINTYMNSTKNRDLKLLDVFRVNRRSEGQRFQDHTKTKNRRLLWHGTNVAVVVAILKSGLRIMPHSGGRVGRGIYFASENGKSANYVGPVGNTGIMFLNEVVLGKEHHIWGDDPSLRAAPPGFDSIIAKGWTEPDPSKDVVFDIEGNPVVVPQGAPIKMDQWTKSSFTQTEYLVYKENQCRIRYLLKIQWD